MIIETPFDLGASLGGIPPGWLCGIIATETGVGATSFCQKIIDMNDEEMMSAWFNLSGNEGSADVVVDCQSMNREEIISCAEKLADVVDIMVFDSVLCMSPQDIALFLRDMQTICVEAKIAALVVGVSNGKNEPVGGRAWENHTDLIVQLHPENRGKITWYPEDEPTGEYFRW